MYNVYRPTGKESILFHLAFGFHQIRILPEDALKTRACYFGKNHDKIRVCKDFFQRLYAYQMDQLMRLLNTEMSWVLTYIAKKTSGARKPINKTNLEMQQNVIDHINSILRLESHYCRKRSKRQIASSLTPKCTSFLKSNLQLMKTLVLFMFIKIYLAPNLICTFYTKE